VFGVPHHCTLKAPPKRCRCWSMQDVPGQSWIPEGPQAFAANGQVTLARWHDDHSAFEQSPLQWERQGP